VPVKHRLYVAKQPRATGGKPPSSPKAFQEFVSEHYAEALHDLSHVESPQPIRWVLELKEVLIIINGSGRL
jgi:hypothetical protein